MDCRPNCGACCIAPSISTSIPGMQTSTAPCKPAGVACAQLDEHFRCKIFGQPDRPACCSGLQASIEMCGNNRDEALAMLEQLELMTRP